jgi:hypothetical protein
MRIYFAGNPGGEPTLEGRNEKPLLSLSLVQ